MITAKIIRQIYDRIVFDETLCRLLAYGREPLSEDNTDIVGSENHETLMDEIIKFSPQIDELERLERSRVCLYKGYSKLAYLNSATIQETIQFDIYVPHKLVGKDFRVYQIENKLVALLDKMNVGVGYLDYSDGRFIQLPPISGYTQYKMIFVLQEGRPSIGRR